MKLSSEKERELGIKIWGQKIFSEFEMNDWDSLDSVRFTHSYVQLEFSFV